MRTLQPIAMLGLALGLTGCVPSLQPLYTEKDTVFDPALVGVWQKTSHIHSTSRIPGLLVVHFHLRPPWRANANPVNVSLSGAYDSTSEVRSSSIPDS